MSFDPDSFAETVASLDPKQLAVKASIVMPELRVRLVDVTGETNVEPCGWRHTAAF